MPYQEFRATGVTKCPTAKISATLANGRVMPFGGTGVKAAAILGEKKCFLSFNLRAKTFGTGPCMKFQIRLLLQNYLQQALATQLGLDVLKIFNQRICIFRRIEVAPLPIYLVDHRV